MLKMESTIIELRALRVDVGGDGRVNSDLWGFDVGKWRRDGQQTVVCTTFYAKCTRWMRRDVGESRLKTI